MMPGFSDWGSGENGTGKGVFYERISMNYLAGIGLGFPGHLLFMCQEVA